MPPLWSERRGAAGDAGNGAWPPYDAGVRVLVVEDETKMAALVRRDGKRLPDDDLSPSDAIVPPSDLTLAETKMFFSEEGLIPDVSN